MSEHNIVQATRELQGLALQKFEHPDWTAGGEPRASVAPTRLETLWINTGTLCNITCRHCYIESSPSNDGLAYITRAEAVAYYDEIAAGNWRTREIGLTGGEPFMNPEILGLIEDALARGFDVLVLTNAMQPMQRPRIEAGLIDLNKRFAGRLTLRVSLDHHAPDLHETERGEGSWAKAIAGLDWLAANGFKLAIAARTCWHESEKDARAGYARLIAGHGWPIDSTNPAQVVMLPEMDGRRDVPEITTRCWGILDKRPDAMMCATSRMVVKRKGAARTTVVPCTLLPYDPRFDMGATLAEAAGVDGGMFQDGAVKLCHPHCSTFCVLGGGSCS
ncbi:MAG TPA: radical SAM protein [Hyphomicrobiaceae bacterium]|nr:radical SAM protein [Hyphomicrobiaceae bacterium]